MKVLLLAEACNPDWTSVPLVGYNMARALAARPDLEVTLASHVRNQGALQRSDLANLADIHCINNEWVAKPLYTMGRLLRGGGSLGWTTNMAVNWPAYICFEHQVASRFRQELDSGGFDVIHRITPVSPTMPSPLATKTDIPMLIGPLNGGLPWPEMYPELRKREREWLVPLRNAYTKLPWYNSSYRQLAGLISGSRHTETEAPNCFTGHRFFLPENGIDPNKFEIADAWQPPKQRFRFVSVGRLVPYKGFHLTLTAMSQSTILRDCEFVIYGDGPDREKLSSMADELQLDVTFAGWKPQRELSQGVRDAQAFVFPSLREFGGGVVLEAMASGLPSIVVDYGGPGELITPQTGIGLPLAPAEELIDSLRQAMELMVRDHDICRRYSAAAIDRIRTHFTWDAKAETVTGFYRQVSDTADPRPSMPVRRELANATG